MSIEHRNITDPDIHEPKGTSTASVGKVYVANGSGSGTWKKITESEVNSGAATEGQVLVADGSGGVRFVSMSHGSISFINVASPYTLTYPATYTKLAPTTTAGGSPAGFTEGTNARLTYTDTHNQHFHIVCTISASQAVGANRDLRFKLYKNGSAVNSSEIVETSISGTKISSALHADIVLSTGDYLEIYAQNDGASGDILIHTFYLFAMGMHED